MKMQTKMKFVCGLGVNDADYSVYSGAVIDGKYKKLWVCPFYQAWRDMLVRCYSEKSQARCPTYSDCTVTPEWLLFSAFKSWMESQDHEGKQLDKDILFLGNKVYGPGTCVFVSSALNSFLTNSASSRGDWPVGVHFDKRHNKFVAQCNNPFTGKRGFIGRFDCPHAAHKAWRKRKHQHACIYAEQQADPRIASALRSRYA